MENVWLFRILTALTTPEIRRLALISLSWTESLAFVLGLQFRDSPNPEGSASVDDRDASDDNEDDELDSVTVCGLPVGLEPLDRCDLGEDDGFVHLVEEARMALAG
ncbi:hypothetical protein BDK51DRAFT_50190 [Blyttiomyces helicus]|uniref:Uncharacterized protein n=1 Tax=Blyttiomyces helicus TaxID=388810 RepID=A0A4P9WMK2_9FUNG|nr:hypothetical protein BDK51DRAFT_50190 [Blyttiomyces helicus]|eukprot:RKO93253.1 hypothetical protein BDK51DRAFT_50190 [Blyttiomyces helicus]